MFNQRDSQRSNRSWIWDYVRASGFGVPQAMITTILTQPFRNAQMLQQVKHGEINLFKALEELTLLGSFKGLPASTVKLALQNALFNPALLFADRLITDEFSRENPISSAMAKSFFSTLSKVALHPFDVLLTRAITDASSPKDVFGRMSQEFHSQPNMLSKVGVGYRGVLPEAIKQVIGNGCLFLIKDQISQAKAWCGIEKTMDKKLSTFDAMFTGLLIAVMKNAITQPIDTVSRVMQANQASNVKEALRLLDQRAVEANKSLLSVAYRGFVPKTFASAIVMATTVAMLEFCKNERSNYR